MTGPWITWHTEQRRLDMYEQTGEQAQSRAARPTLNTFSLGGCPAKFFLLQTEQGRYGSSSSTELLEEGIHVHGRNPTRTVALAALKRPFNQKSVASFLFEYFNGAGSLMKHKRRLQDESRIMVSFL